MSGCNGKCSSCGPEDCEPQTEYNITYSKKPIEIDMAEFMKPLPKQKADGTDLNSQCPHYPYSTVPRSQCETCIKEWVEAKEDEHIRIQIKEFKMQYKQVAAHRMQLAWEDKQHKRKL